MNVPRADKHHIAQIQLCFDCVAPMQSLPGGYQNDLIVIVRMDHRTVVLRRVIVQKGNIVSVKLFENKFFFVLNGLHRQFLRQK